MTLSSNAGLAWGPVRVAMGQTRAKPLAGEHWFMRSLMVLPLAALGLAKAPDPASAARPRTLDEQVKVLQGRSMRIVAGAADAEIIVSQLGLGPV